MGDLLGVIIARMDNFSKKKRGGGEVVIPSGGPW